MLLCLGEFLNFQIPACFAKCRVTIYKVWPGYMRKDSSTHRHEYQAEFTFSVPGKTKKEFLAVRPNFNHNSDTSNGHHYLPHILCK